MIIEFLCYRIQSSSPKHKEPVSWCILGNGKTWTGPTLEYAKQQASIEVPGVKFIENCGWILVGEESKLLEPDYQDLLAFGLKDIK